MADVRSEVGRQTRCGLLYFSAAAVVEVEAMALREVLLEILIRHRRFFTWYNAT